MTTDINIINTSRQGLPGKTWAKFKTLSRLNGHSTASMLREYITTAVEEAEADGVTLFIAKNDR